jgi:hypothetical protein
MVVVPCPKVKADQGIYSQKKVQVYLVGHPGSALVSVRLYSHHKLKNRDLLILDPCLGVAGYYVAALFWRGYFMALPRACHTGDFAGISLHFGSRRACYFFRCMDNRSNPIDRNIHSGAAGRGSSVFSQHGYGRRRNRTVDASQYFSKSRPARSGQVPGRASHQARHSQCSRPIGKQ